jgi:hypothetical protein
MAGDPKEVNASQAPDALEVTPTRQPYLPLLVVALSRLVTTYDTALYRNRSI